MIHAHDASEAFIDPAYAGGMGSAPVPKHHLPDGMAAPESAHRRIHDEALLCSHT